MKIRMMTRTLFASALLISTAACGSDAEPSGDAGSGGSDKAGGTIAIITVDPSNPYWKAEIDTAKATAEELGYTAAASHNNNTESNT